MSSQSSDNPSQGTSSDKTNGRRAGQSPRSPAARTAAGSSDDSQDLSQRARQAQQQLEERYHQLEQRYGDVRTRLREANDRAREFIEENPVVCIAGAVGIGYLVGRLASRRWLQ
ncbi:MAG: hypothetical protein ACOCV2_01660 [Persicimonas sp.]